MVTIRHLLIASCCLGVAGSSVCAQPTYGGNLPVSPYSRPQLSPYLNLMNSGTAANTYYNGVLKEIDYRNQLMRPILLSPDLLSGYDGGRIGQLYAADAPQSAEEWINQRLRETQLSPSGHLTGYLMSYPYYTLPNQRSFMPYNPNRTRPMR